MFRLWALLVRFVSFLRFSLRCWLWALLVRCGLVLHFAFSILACVTVWPCVLKFCVLVVCLVLAARCGFGFAFWL